jgi:type II secretory pathway component PulK
MMKDRFKTFKAPKTIAGFPVSDGETGSAPEEKSKGIALLIAIFMTAMLLLFMSDMIVNSTVEVKLAAANRDNVKAEYVAKSGVNLASFLIAVDFAIDLYQFEISSNPNLPNLPNLSILPADGPQDPWGYLNGFPIGGDSAELINTFQEGFDLSKLSDDKVLSKLKDLDGQFTLVVSDEMSKINVNYCAVGQGIKCTTMLLALMSCPAESDYLENKKLVAKEIVAHIRDWADTDSNVELASGASSESDPYADRDPKVFPKNAYFDTIEELKLIPGWDDDLHEIFSPYLTVYPMPSQTARQSDLNVNFNSADRSLLACLLPKSATDCAESAAGYYDNLGNSMPAGTPEGLRNILSRYFCESRNEVIKQFSQRSDVYRINVTATVGDQTRTIRAIVERGPADEISARDNINESIRFLDWKML